MLSYLLKFVEERYAIETKEAVITVNSFTLGELSNMVADGKCVLHVDGDSVTVEACDTGNITDVKATVEYKGEVTKFDIELGDDYIDKLADVLIHRVNNACE